MVCRKPPTRKEIRVIPDFWWSGVKLPLWLPVLFLAITCVSDIQVGHVNPFQTFKFQDLSNDMKKASIHSDLTPEIAQWRFENPFGTPTPKMEFIWECEG
jgi:hypothetical protein